MELIKSPMNYTGGKFRLLPQLLPLFPKRIGTFIDLFTGGASVAINVDASKIVANDNNSKVIGIYKRFQDFECEELLERLDKIISEWGLSKDNKAAYLALRDYYNKTQDNPLILYVLLCHAFNYQIEFNRNGELNSPFGARYFNSCIRRKLIKFMTRVKNVVFTDYDFRELKIDKLKKDDFVYCDPPYLITAATYNRDGKWNLKCENDLLVLLDELDGHGVRFGLSNVFENKGKINERLVEWSQKYNVHHLSYNYMNSSYQSKDKSEDSTDEVFITNY